jgi:hypothetical protein
LHDPDAHPLLHTVRVVAYEHTPFAQVPDALYVLSVDPSVHVAAGGVVQTTPAHRSVPVHALFTHELVQTTS